MKLRALLAAMSVGVALLILSAPNAIAAGRPGWALDVTPEPTDFVAGSNETQLIETSSSEPSFELFFREHVTTAIATGAPAAAVQSALEALPTVGTGNVEVAAGGQADSYEAEFKGVLGNTHVPSIEGVGVTTTVVEQGSSSGTLVISAFNDGEVAAREAVITDVLPPGFRAKEAGALVENSGLGVNTVIEQEIWDCTGNGPLVGSVAGATVVTCRNNPFTLPSFEGGAGLPTFSSPFGFHHPDPVLGITVEAPSEGTGFENRASLGGGGAPGTAMTSTLITRSSTPAPGGLTQADAWFTTADGETATQAGSHPYAATFITDFATRVNGEGNLTTLAPETRELDVRLPAGFIGDLHGVPQCTREQLQKEGCPPSSMVGTFAAQFPNVAGYHQIFNMRPTAGTPVEFGFIYFGISLFVRFEVNSGSDYSVTARVENIPQREAFQAVLTLWGVPQSRSHNVWRGQEGGCSTEEMERPVFSNPNQVNYCAEPQGVSETPILSLPTRCTEAGSSQSILFRQARGWQDESAVRDIPVPLHDANGEAAAVTGCGDLAFGPLFSLAATNTRADAPSGLEAQVAAPAGESPNPQGLNIANIADTTVKLPPGVTINPGQASGLTACKPGEDGLTSAGEAAEGKEDNGPAGCNPASRIGSFTVESPLIEASPEKRFEGGIYVLESQPPDIKLLLAASADGVNLKLVGDAHLNVLTGQVETTFDETPDIPFSSLKLKFEQGQKAPLVTPAHCGQFSSIANFTSWGSVLYTQPHPSTFGSTEGPEGGACPSTPLAFAPSLNAGTTNPSAGKSSSFDLKVTRGDGQQNIKSITSVLPEGQLAKLAGVPLCPESAASSGNCPAGSQVGKVTAAVGPGPSPLQVPQPGKAPTAVYLAGPYKGAPYSLVVKVPAQAGPFDLGNVITRVALHVDESTTQVTAVSDPLPQILDGVPLEYRSIDVSVDRPEFIVNPTNCEPKKVTASVGGSDGATANLSSRYQVGDCASLAFKPTLKLSLNGQVKRLGHPALKAVLTYPKGSNANVARAQVNLPGSEFLDQGNLNKTCTKPVLIAGKCPKTTIYGKAKAWTPLLEKPLEGPVYLVGGYGFKLPALVAELNGQLRVLLVGKVDSGKNKGIRNTFEAVPDAPVSRFELQLKGGKKYGLLENSENLCKKPQKAISRFSGQNGKTYDTEPVIQISCGKKSKKSSGKKK